MGDGIAGAVRAGEIVYDHFARRLARVERVREAGLELVDDRTELRWTADDFYRDGLERLERPHPLVIAYECSRLAERRARFDGLSPLEQGIAACRSLRTGPQRRPAQRGREGLLLSDPIDRHELERELQAFGGAGSPSFDRLLELLPPADADGRLRVVSGALRVRLPEVGWLVDRVVQAVSRPRGASKTGPEEDAPTLPPLVPRGSPSHTDEEEAALLWALREVVRIRGLAERGSVDDHRLDVLQPRLWAVFRPSVARHLDERTHPDRPWADPDTAPDQAFEQLLDLLRGATALPRNVAGLAELLVGSAGQDRRPSQVIHNALYDCLDVLRRDGCRPVLPMTAFDPKLDDDGQAVRPADSVLAAPGLRDLGFLELRQLLVDQAPLASESARRARARELLRDIRAAFLKGLPALQAARPAQYRAVLLDFLTLLDRQRIADVTGINYNTLRGWFPRSGDCETRPPVFVRSLVPEALAGLVDRFGRVFPVLRAGLLPRQEEIDALVDDEGVRLALSALFVLEDLDGRGDFWREHTLAQAARDLGQTELELIERTLLPFLDRLVEHRRARSLDRGALPPWLRLPAPPTERSADDELAALAVLLFGAPDGAPLGQLLAARTDGDLSGRRRLLKDAGLTLLDVVDLELGRRWATPGELDGLRRALGPEADDALVGLRPLDLAAPPTRPDEEGP